jgi:hypothetical protein
MLFALVFSLASIQFFLLYESKYSIIIDIGGSEGGANG